MHWYVAQIEFNNKGTINAVPVVLSSGFNRASLPHPRRTRLLLSTVYVLSIPGLFCSVFSCLRLFPVSVCSLMPRSPYVSPCSPMFPYAPFSPVCPHYPIMTCLVCSPVPSTFLLFVFFMTLPLLRVFVVRRWVRDSLRFDPSPTWF